MYYNLNLAWGGVTPRSTHILEYLAFVANCAMYLIKGFHDTRSLWHFFRYHISLKTCATFWQEVQCSTHCFKGEILLGPFLRSSILHESFATHTCKMCVGSWKMSPTWPRRFQEERFLLPFQKICDLGHLWAMGGHLDSLGGAISESSRPLPFGSVKKTVREREKRRRRKALLYSMVRVLLPFSSGEEYR